MIKKLSGKYLKKLIGKTEIEDALKRLDKLTDEEVRVVTAQVLGATHAVENKVTRMDVRVAGVDNNVKAIDDKVAVVIDGAYLVLIGQQENMFNFGFRGERDEGSHTTSGRRHRSSSGCHAYCGR